MNVDSVDTPALLLDLDAVERNLDAAFVNLSVLSATLDQGLGIYADLLLHPAFALGKKEPAVLH